MQRDQPLQEGIDYYVDENGRLVFTEKYHLDRGYCCKNGCRHCPFGYRKSPAPPAEKHASNS